MSYFIMKDICIKFIEIKFSVAVMQTISNPTTMSLINKIGRPSLFQSEKAVYTYQIDLSPLDLKLSHRAC